ncbi:Carbon catabolite repressor protein 4-like 5 [Glycine soja]|uniref:Carbon catabolite repressor protein 4-like 5 n=1 Tax=Glycine soja TaxID=3848 RepID=A0A445JUD7_GLYSO|nr:Carbon catabolite repressor protein 4-like 5 [Glycine soja]
MSQTSFSNAWNRCALNRSNYGAAQAWEASTGNFSVQTEKKTFSVGMLKVNTICCGYFPAKEKEVDHFNDLDDLFQNSGFKGVYKAHTGEALNGCAVFWKDNLFKLLHQEDIEFQRFGMRNNVAQLCVFEANHEKKESDACNLTSIAPSTGKRRFVVGNIHVLFNPNCGDIKLGQVRLLLDKAYKLSQEWGNIPVIIAGDLNSVPQVCISMSVLRQLYRWSVEELRLASGEEGVTRLQHQLKLCGAYSGVPGNHRTRDDIEEPLATSYHSKFMGTVDYIWHSEDLIPVRVLETLPIDTLRRSRGLPSEKWGSDHLAVVCEVAFANNGNVFVFHNSYSRNMSYYEIIISDRRHDPSSLLQSRTCTTKPPSIMCHIYTFASLCTTFSHQPRVAMWNDREGSNDNIFCVVEEKGSIADEDEEGGVHVGEEVVGGVLAVGRGEFEPIASDNGGGAGEKVLTLFLSSTGVGHGRHRIHIPEERVFARGREEGEEVLGLRVFLTI